MKKYMFFHNLKMKIRGSIERFKKDRLKIDNMGEKVTRSMKKNMNWLTGEKMQRIPGPYSPFDRSPNIRSKKIFGRN